MEGGGNVKRKGVGRRERKSERERLRDLANEERTRVRIDEG